MMMTEAVDRIMRFIEATYGEKARTVFQKLFELSKELTDHELAKELNIHESEIRKILYQLSEEGLVNARRVRDRETNYYIYYWRANIKDLPRILLRRKKMIVTILRKRLDYEERNSFYCPRCGRKYSFDEALTNEFRCPECSTPLENIDNSEALKKMRGLIENLEREILEEERRIISRSA
jgi:transcription initiation factor TFIIE subunit alpha